MIVCFGNLRLHGDYVMKDTARVAIIRGAIDSINELLPDTVHWQLTRLGLSVEFDIADQPATPSEMDSLATANGAEEEDEEWERTLDSRLAKVKARIEAELHRSMEEAIIRGEEEIAKRLAQLFPDEVSFYEEERQTSNRQEPDVNGYIFHPAELVFPNSNSSGDTVSEQAELVSALKEEVTPTAGEQTGVVCASLEEAAELAHRNPGRVCWHRDKGYVWDGDELRRVQAAGPKHYSLGISEGISVQAEQRPQPTSRHSP